MSCIREPACQGAPGVVKVVSGVAPESLGPAPHLQSFGHTKKWEQLKACARRHVESFGFKARHLFRSLRKNLKAKLQAPKK